MPDDTFTYRGHELEYLDHAYNCTRLNERAVEVPIAEAWLRQVIRKPGLRGLEIGNVLAHYDLRPYCPCLDLHEQPVPGGPHIINEDVRAWEPYVPLDFIVSISTFEHVGQDEDRWEDACPALERVAGMLAPDGSMLVTIGLGQNPALDEVLLGGMTSAATVDTFVSSQCVEHAGAHRIWYETGTDETRPYVGHSGMGAGAVWVGQFGRPVL